MTTKYYRFTLDVRDDASSVCISARRGDRGRRLCVRFTDGGLPYGLPEGCYAVFNAVRAVDGKVFFGDCIITGDVILYELDAALAVAVGRIDCDITLYSADGDMLTSPKFGIMVYAGATSGEELEGEEEYRTLGELVNEARELRDDYAEFVSECDELNEELEESIAEAEEAARAAGSAVSNVSGALTELEEFKRSLETQITNYINGGHKHGTDDITGLGDYIADWIAANGVSGTVNASDVQGLSVFLSENGFKRELSGSYTGDGTGVVTEVYADKSYRATYREVVLCAENAPPASVTVTSGMTGEDYTLEQGDSVYRYFNGIYSEYDGEYVSYGSDVALPVMMLTGNKLYVAANVDIDGLSSSQYNGSGSAAYPNNDDLSAVEFSLFNTLGVTYTWTAK